MSLNDHPDNPVPEGGYAGFLETPDKVKIRYAHWGAKGSQRKGTVTLLHGRAEFIEKYFEVIEDLRQRGFAVVTFDWRGQGGSQRLSRNPKRAYVSSFKKFRIDLRTVLKEVSLANYPGPHFALAHSTGALVVLTDTERLRTMLDRAVLCSPLLGLPRSDQEAKLSRIRRKIIRILTLGLFGRTPLKAQEPKTSFYGEKIGFPLARFLSMIGLGRTFVLGRSSNMFSSWEVNRQTSDRVRYDRIYGILERSPEVGVGAPTFGWLNAAARAMLQLRRRDAGPNIKLPCLILAAGADQVVSTPMIEDFVSRTRAAAYVEIPGAKHELMFESDRFRDQFWAAFEAFVPGAEAEKRLRDGQHE